jgi:catechol 2,3-dioxygenase-like lactoylglutathione lyase family enzyme
LFQCFDDGYHFASTNSELLWSMGEVKITIAGIDHVLLAMPPGAEDQASWFYGELLGLSEVEKPPPLVSRGGCWFEGSEIQIHLGVQEDFVSAQKAHPALLVTDLEHLREKLKAANVQVVSDETLPNVRRFYAYDPFGNRIEFIQNGDGFSQS